MFKAPVKCLFTCVAYTRLDDLERCRTEVDEGEDVAHGIVHGARVKETHSNIHRCQCYLGPDLPKAADEFQNE